MHCLFMKIGTGPGKFEATISDKAVDKEGITEYTKSELLL